MKLSLTPPYRRSGVREYKPKHSQPTRRTYGGMPIDEIACRLGISDTMVRKIERNALEKLRALIRLKYGPDVEISDLFTTANEQSAAIASRVKRVNGRIVQSTDGV